VVFDDFTNLEEEVPSVVVESPLLPRLTEGLTREPAAQYVVCGHILRGDEGNVTVGTDAVILLVHPPAPLVDVGREYALVSTLGERLVKPTNATE
jgi:hypothetical protein